MKHGIILVLKQLLEKNITVYATGLRATGKLYIIDTDLRVIGIKQGNNIPVLIDIKSINAIESEHLGECVF